MKLTIGSIITKTLDNGSVIQLGITGITLITDQDMPFVSVAMHRMEKTGGELRAGAMTTVFDELVRWMNEPGWQVIQE